MARPSARWQRGWRGAAIALAALVWAESLVACGPATPDETPEGALMMFIEAMKRGDTSSHFRQEAFRLLSAEARRALEQRAHMATSLAHREFEPWEMLPPGRFRVRFAPRSRDGIRAVVDGDRAIVMVRGPREGQEARVPMVREDQRWRVDLEIPEIHRGASPAPERQTDYREF